MHFSQSLEEGPDMPLSMMLDATLCVFLGTVLGHLFLTQLRKAKRQDIENKKYQAYKAKHDRYYAMQDKTTPEAMRLLEELALEGEEYLEPCSRSHAGGR
jgi:hypothetical protein